MHLITMSDAELWRLCQEYGGAAQGWLKKFAGLLPEVYKRRLYKRRGFASIHHFAKVVAGMNERTVDRILNLRKRLEGKPHLLSLFESGTQGWSKLEKVVGVANEENERELAGKVEGLSTRALEAFVTAENLGNLAVEAGTENGGGSRYDTKDDRTNLAVSVEGEIIEGEKNKRDPSAVKKGWHAHVEQICHEPALRQKFIKRSFRLEESVYLKLKKVKKFIGKKRGEALSWNETFKYWPCGAEDFQVCAKRMEGTMRANRALQGDRMRRSTQVEQVPREQGSREEQVTRGQRAKSRYIPMAVRRIVEARSRRICEFRGCREVAEDFHHIVRYADGGCHEADNLWHFCGAHHELAHAGLIDEQKLEVREVAQQSEQDVMAQKHRLGWRRRAKG